MRFPSLAYRIKRMSHGGIGAQYVKGTLLANTNEPETK